MDDHGLEFMVESLENRQMLAGDVSVELTNRLDLVIDGDDASNQVIIEVSDGILEVTGFDGTSINGLVDESVEFDVGEGLRDLKVKLRDGDDHLKTSTGEFRNARVDMGDDNDLVEMELTQFAGNVKVSLGDGNPSEDGSLGDQEVVTELITIEGRLTVRGDDTNDLVLWSSSTILGGTRVSLGDGDDAVQVVSGEIGGRSSFRLGDGDDLMVILQTSVPGTLRASGGSGFDVFVNFALDEDFEPRLSGFENV